ncbi:phytoene desaturase family protein [Marinigracilibium pacificum]|uniref:NAD(P)-binding protein n=1 Tax=Marinigracilibium pacificum TaxID=2729599 RepID=A0A848JBU3_9BACT|nr:NAD(P)/FAD-dependent oxidoreductase [Marinigracilibium pacificum]NMM50472.1 NAD(P)-binding protein [Marinigracilibium pacificum]
MQITDVAIIGSGLSSLVSAALLANEGVKVTIFERNYLPGGCTSSYWRKGYTFDSGATTIVGFDKGMPMQIFSERTGIEFNLRKLDPPMEVHLPDNEVLTRYNNIEEWVDQTINYWGDKPGLKEFWKEMYRVSQLVWKISGQQTHFPPSKTKDLLKLIGNFQPGQLRLIPEVFKNVQSEIDKYNLNDLKYFKTFIDEQLLISAQNHASEVNKPFGAAALCYTNYTNYYSDGGLMGLIQPILDYLEGKGCELIFRNPVEKITKSNGGYFISSKNGIYQSKYLISGIPVNNTEKIIDFNLNASNKSKILSSEKLYSAFQMGIGFKGKLNSSAIHHQIILEEPIAELDADSFFLSVNHPEDLTRAPEGHSVANISMHIRNPEKTRFDKDKVVKRVLKELQIRNLIDEASVDYLHSSTQFSWEKWTGRAFGFVGGYPQYFSIKPWQMIDSRIDGDKAYQCGDSTYPGQGIPGVALSGIIAFEKLRSDWL